MSDDRNTINPAERKKLKGLLDEIVIQLARIDDCREQIKAIAETAEEELNIKKKIVNKLARSMHKRDYPDVQAENEHFEYLYEAVAEGRDDAKDVQEEDDDDEKYYE